MCNYDFWNLFSANTAETLQEYNLCVVTPQACRDFTKKKFGSSTAKLVTDGMICSLDTTGSDCYVSSGYM